MPSEIFPSIGGGRNSSFTPFFFSRDGEADGDGDADGDAVGDAVGDANGVGPAEIITIGAAAGVATGEGTGVLC